MAILVRGLGLLMLGVASTAGQLLGSVLIDELIPSLGNTVYLVTIIGTLFALVRCDCDHPSLNTEHPKWRKEWRCQNERFPANRNRPGGAYGYGADATA
ncbi:Putative inner membrane protein [Salmonella enterica subsp. enterica]|uniref:Inner membrane protein n=1 Tax=Salmonella enterica I TaxID=59201 RepID=A0A447N2J2_SALET|nr:Putative inner membrane protein [Salmonella enterica subsp. enterica]